MRVLLVTACGRSKEREPAPAWRLYRSSRIRYLKKVADRVGVGYAILSAGYGLVESGEILEPYDHLMDDGRCEELLPSIVEKLRKLAPEVVVFYRGGAGKPYLRCIRRACTTLGIPLVEVGYANMGDIRKVEGILKELAG